MHVLYTHRLVVVDPVLFAFFLSHIHAIPEADHIRNAKTTFPTTCKDMCEVPSCES